ncbi:tail fiber domain-containing protein [Priestia aryabhattai]|uniref:tail fiber domain-containing protein n=1 Tax=Priestia aryabhattai TaxID=412384 RepID=UPI0015F65440|nr:tail fiber domain-containing protein [Priestia aryabhattai]
MADLRFKNKVTGEWEELKLNTRLTTLENTVTVNSNSNVVNIGITTFNPVEDVLMVFKNTVHMIKDKEYTIDDGLLAIRHVDYPTGYWNQDTTFHFMVFKNVRRQIETNDGALIQDGTISNAKLANTMNIGSILNLVTTRKESVVAGINSVKEEVNVLNMDIAEVNDLIEVIDGQIQLRVTKTEFDALKNIVTTNESRLEVAEDEIALRVEKTEYNVLKDKVEKNEASIVVHADEISQTVKKTDYNGNVIASLINQSATTIRLQASKIQLAGAVTVLSELSGDLGTINAGILNAVTINGGTGSFTGDITAKTLFVEGIGGGNPNIKIGSNGATIDLYDGSLRVKQSAGTYYSMNNDGMHILWKNGKAFMRFDTTDDSHNVIKGGWAALKFLTSSYAIQARISDDSGYADFHASNFRATNNFTGVGNARLESTNGSASLVAVGANQTAYIASKNEARVVDTDDFNTYRPIRASSFPTGSSATFKTNIKPFEEDANALLKDVNIYEYYLKGDIDNLIFDKKRIGMISETVPAIIRDEMGVDNYTILSLVWKQNQQQLGMIETLQTDKNDLQNTIAIMADDLNTVESKNAELEELVHSLVEKVESLS